MSEPIPRLTIYETTLDNKKTTLEIESINESSSVNLLAVINENRSTNLLGVSNETIQNEEIQEKIIQLG